MVQIGNYHIGKAETATEPIIDVLEAALLWDLLKARYLCVEETQIYQNYAHDPEFKKIIGTVGIKVLEKQTDELEKQMNLFNVLLPKRPPKSYNRPSCDQVFTDEFIFQKIFRGCQYLLDAHVRALQSSITNDSLRTMFTDFFNEEVMLFDKLIKYGKQKGWLEQPPVYRPT